MRWTILVALLALAGCAPTYTGDDDAAGDDDDDAADDDAADDDAGDDDAGDDDTGDDDTGDDDTGDDDTDPPWPDAYMYAHTKDDLYAVEPDPPYALTHVATFGETNITDFAMNIDGAMYAVTFDIVYGVDPNTGSLTPIAEMVGESFFSMTALSDGRLLVGSDSEIYEVDVSGGTLNHWGSIPDWEFAGDMVGLPDGLLYCLVYPTDYWSDTTFLIVLDPSTGQVTEIGPTNAGAMFGVGFAEWMMYGFNRDGEVLDIDIATGAASVIANHGLDFWGAATNPLRWD